MTRRTGSMAACRYGFPRRMVHTTRTEADFAGMDARHPPQVRLKWSETWVNNNCLLARANGDVQPIEGAFGAAYYITQYASKTKKTNEDQAAPRTAAASRSSEAASSKCHLPLTSRYM